MVEILAEEENIDVIVSSVSYEEATKLFNEKKPEVVLPDRNLASNGSLKLLKENNETCSKTSPIILFFKEHN